MSAPNQKQIDPKTPVTVAFGSFAQFMELNEIRGNLVEDVLADIANFHKSVAYKLKLKAIYDGQINDMIKKFQELHSKELEEKKENTASSSVN